MNIKLDQQKGYIALITVLIIMTIALLVGLGANYYSYSESELGLSQFQSAESYYVAYACAEEALIRLKNDYQYQPADPYDIVDINGCECRILYPIKGQRNKNRTIQVESSVNNKIKRLEIKVSQLNPETIIRSWQQVKKFNL